MKITEKNTNEVCDEDVIVTKDISKEDMEKAVEYIELLKLKHK